MALHRSAIIIDGHALANQLIASARERLAQSPQANKTHTLATVLVGDSPQSKLYVGLKLRKAKEAGLTPKLISLAKDVSQDVLNTQLHELSSNPDIRGILLQLPLPQHLDTGLALEAIAPEKDVDGLTLKNLGALMRNEPALLPCTPLGVMRILEHYKIPTKGKRAIVVGRAYLTGLPIALLLARKGADATVTLCHSATENLAEETRRADILICSTGCSRLITDKHVKPGAAVIDVGVSVGNDGTITGDVDFDSVCNNAGWITPMPGGTGPLTVACLIENTIHQALKY
ncbi:MAG: bifunctional 5,10-methylenetetrahydrofolate dehydrogenase/5,10-methenyltetrahydrofolate cyclohydrolase [Candidatus Oxydemutatoraceae bacterium WSBS_2016_MAG_OTU14]